MNDLSNAEWFKSSHSGSGGDCLEVAWLDAGLVGVRDSKDPDGPALAFNQSEWTAFTARVKNNEGHPHSH
ncbi:DUF397 domain-containing protein [Nocardia carnea]|uniref:DUF397 domain-containing protein n=1 Tax=Nocardia carnea TaxID=37328 RepID=A0ABW7TGL9_9NOCA|nr:DUF397 domain-containing protein [Nocardia carnea]